MPNCGVKYLILFCFLTKLSSCADPPAIIFISPEQHKNIGESVDLNCTVNVPDDLVIWMKKDRDRQSDNTVLSTQKTLAIKDSRFKLIVSNDSKTYLLQINDIQTIDTAIYECQINLSPKVTSQVELLVRTPPKISDKLTAEPISVIEGQSAELKCIADGFPRPGVTWIREYNAILPGGGHVFSGNILKIESVSKVDRGTYYCVADNGVGKPDNKGVNFEVEFAPIISVPRPKVAQAVDYDIELECRVEAYPAPSVLWYKNDEVIRNDADNSISNTASEKEITTSILHIKTIESSQYGDYYCKASNKIGHAEARINLFAQSYPNINFSGLLWNNSNSIHKSKNIVLFAAVHLLLSVLYHFY